MMKILQILSSTNVNSGVANVVMNYYRNIDRENFQFDFLVFWQAPKSFNEEIESLGGKVYYFTKPGLKTYAKAKKELKDFFIAHKGEYDIVHCHEILVSKQVFSAAKKFGEVSKCISHSHNSRLADSILKKIRNRLLVSNLTKESDYCFACSREAAVSAFGKTVLNSDKYRLIYNAINLGKFKFSQEARQCVREELNLDGYLVLGNVGRLCYQKNQIFALKVLQELLKSRDDVKLLLVGEGQDRQMLEKYVRENSLEKNVIFTGIRKDIPDVLSAMDCFVFPSVYEGLPVGLVEAQTNGLFCIWFENITDEVRLADCISVMSQRSSAAEWASTVLQAESELNKRECGFIKVKEKGFDIADSAKQLEKLYNYIKKN